MKNGLDTGVHYRIENLSPYNEKYGQLFIVYANN